jgi:hypothetical protein
MHSAKTNIQQLLEDTNQPWYLELMLLHYTHILISAIMPQCYNTDLGMMGSGTVVGIRHGLCVLTLEQLAHITTIHCRKIGYDS